MLQILSQLPLPSAPAFPPVDSEHNIQTATEKIRNQIATLGLNFESLGIHEWSSSVSGSTPDLQISCTGGTAPPTIAGSLVGKQKSWLLNFTIISFFMNGQLFSEHHRIRNMLGLPHCSAKHWREIVRWLGEHVYRLAECLCAEVQEEVQAHGESERWVTSFDGYYLTRGHQSNNPSATLHDYATAKKHILSNAQSKVLDITGREHQEGQRPICSMKYLEK